MHPTQFCLHTVYLNTAFSNFVNNCKKERNLFNTFFHSSFEQLISSSLSHTHSHASSIIKTKQTLSSQECCCFHLSFFDENKKLDPAKIMTLTIFYLLFFVRNLVANIFNVTCLGPPKCKFSLGTLFSASYLL